MGYHPRKVVLGAVVMTKCFSIVAAKSWLRSRKRQDSTPASDLPNQSNYGNSSRDFSVAHELKFRAVGDKQSTCGFHEGDISKPRTAAPGFACRFDTTHDLWGFCPTTVIVATDCGLAGNCIDSHACTAGCGLTGISGLTTFTCADTQFCSTVLLTSSVDVFSYIACGAGPSTEHMNVAGTTAIPPVSTPVPATPTPAATQGGLTPTTRASQILTLPAISSSVTSKTSGSISASDSQSVTTSPAVLPQFSQTSGTSSGNQATGSPSTEETSTGSGPSSLGSKNLGAIIGGVLGGLALIVVLILGIMFLRKWSHHHPLEDISGGRRSRSSRGLWWETTDMQTAGLHEKEGDMPRLKHENEADVPVRHEKEAQLPPLPRIADCISSPVELP